MKKATNNSLRDWNEKLNVNNDYTIVLQDRDAQGNYILNTNRSNHLVYKESILSGYGITNFTKANLIFKQAYALNTSIITHIIDF
jgi:hypothetical protein